MTQGVDLELDHLTTQMTRHLERALIAARRSAQARAQQQRLIAARSAGQGSDPAAADLARRWRTEALAARWAAADALRRQDPATAAAWDNRIQETGVDLHKVCRESEPSEPSPGRTGDADPASTLVAEHLAEIYTGDALAADAAGPGPVHEPTAGDLIAAATSTSPTADPAPVLNPPPPSLGADVHLGRDAEQDLGLDR